MQLNPVIGISGQLGSGKSSLALLLSQRTGWPKAAFGDYLRLVAAGRGLSTDRATLQQLGEEQIAIGWESFCTAVLDHFNWRQGRSLVIDGIRHIDAIRTLDRLLHPQTIFHVHMAINEELRHNRLVSRDGCQVLLGRFEEHSTEADVKAALPSSADMVVDAALPVEELAETILSAMLPQAPIKNYQPSTALSPELWLSSANCRPELN